MALLFNVIAFPELSRMTGLWTNSTHDPDAGNEVSVAQLVVFAPDQDPVVESDFLCSHLPFQVGGFHGVFADGQGWMVVLQKAPAAASVALMGAMEPHEVLFDSTDRAVRFNDRAEIRDSVWWTRADLVDHYDGVDANIDAVADWSIAELLWGLLAECSGVPLTDVVAGYDGGCAFPRRDHDCQGDTFRDVFALWTTGALNSPEPDLDDVFSAAPAPGFVRWTRKKLKKLKRRELMRMAVDDGWDWGDIDGVPKDVLIRLMIDGQTRPPGAP